MPNAPLSITEHGLSAVLASLGATPAQIDVARTTAHRHIAVLVHKTARWYAPISPSRNDLNKALKRRKRTRRKLVTPGGLQRSVGMRHSRDEARIFVAANSEAGRYAVKIHDERGQTWNNRGLGTVRKGPQAREMFIARAIDDNLPQIRQIIEAQVEQALRRAGG
jgi:hypothetical protein